MARIDHAERFAIEAIPENLFRTPLDYLTTDHVRQEILCGHLEQMASAAGGAMETGEPVALRTFLAQDFRHHIADETELLFPCLRDRCRADDDIEPTLAQISRGHAADELLAAGLIDALDAGEPAGDRFVRIAIKLIESLRAHLPFENRRILPLARRRLTPEDLDTIGRRMAARRGADYPE